MEPACGLPDRESLRDDDQTRRRLVRNEALEVIGHRLTIMRDQNSSVFGGQCQHLVVGYAKVQSDLGCSLKIDGRFKPLGRGDNPFNKSLSA
jgi:hypothetical protein